MSLLRLNLIINRAVIFVLGSSIDIGALFVEISEVRRESWIEDGKTLVVLDRPAIVAAMLVTFLTTLTVYTIANVCDQDCSAGWRCLFFDIPDGTLLPLDIVVHIKSVATFTRSAEAVPAPLVILLGFRLKLRNIQSPNRLGVIVLLRKFRENYVHPLALYALNLPLNPAFDLRAFHIAIDPDIDIVAGLQRLSPGLVSSRHFLYIFVGHLKVSFVQNVVRLVAPGHGHCEILIISFVLQLVAEQVHEGAHRVRCHFDILQGKTKIMGET